MKKPGGGRGGRGGGGRGGRSSSSMSSSRPKPSSAPADLGFGSPAAASDAPVPLGRAPVSGPGDIAGTAWFGAEDTTGLAAGDVPASALALYSGRADEAEAELREKRNKKKKGKAAGGAFENFGFSPPLLKAITRKGYKQPTPIQRRAIPKALEGRDLVAMARTGSGKSAAFLLPMIQKLGQHETKVGVRGLVLSPTRELSLQTLRFFKEFARFTDLRVVCIVGGESIESQFTDLTTNPDVIIATPGRLLHLTVEVAEFSLSSVEFLVFDEADRLFELGLTAQIEALLAKMHERRQTLLFSATMPAIVADFVRAGLREPEIVRLDAESKISEDLSMAFFLVRPDEKFGALYHVLTQVIKRGELTIVFAATRHHVEFLETLLRKARISCAVVYGTMDHAARKINVAKFRNKLVDVLVVTDVAARGIDIPLLDHVVNFDFPPTPKLFIHRVGRAARAGRTGTAFNLVAPDETPYMVDLHLFLGRRLLSEETEGSRSYYGRIPDDVLQADVETVKGLIKGDVEMESQLRTVKNAYKLYYKTRAGASSESVRRARELNIQAVHPHFVKQLRPAELEREAFLQHIRSYVPSQTVFELRDRRGTAGATASSAAAAAAVRRKNAWAIERENERVRAIRRAREEEVAIGEGVLLEDISDGQRALRGIKRSRRQSNDASSASGSSAASSDGDAKGKKKNKNKNKGKGTGTGKGGKGSNGLGDGGSYSSASSSEDTDAAIGRGRDRGRQMGESAAPASKKRSSKKKPKSGAAAAARAEMLAKQAEFALPSARPTQHADDGYAVNSKRRGDSGPAKLDDTVMDILPEDGAAAMKRRAIIKWDARKKKYITLKGGDAETFASSTRAGRRTESGAVITKQMEKKLAKSGKSLYSEWQKRTNNRIPAAGETESANSGGRGVLSRKRYRHNQGTGAPGGGRPGSKRDDVRSVDQIKAARRKETRREFAQKTFRKGDSKKAGEGGWRDKGSSRRAATNSGGGPGGKGSAPPRSRKLTHRR